MKKVLLSFLLMLLPMLANADESGMCGDNVTWTYVEATKTLTISGSGDMYNYSNSPFNNREDIQKVVIYSGVSTIGSNVFNGCSSLTSVTIPNSVTSIGDWAFYGCSGLTSITIPNSVTSIGLYAFCGCSGLTSVTILNSVTDIGAYAFLNCNLESAYIYIEDLAAWCETGYPFNCEQHLYVKGEEIKELIIPDNVASIKDNAFYGCISLTSVTIPDGVTSIGNYAFQNCSSLTKISIGRGVNSIGSSAFANCTSLEEVYCYSEQFPQSSGYGGLFSGSPIDLATLYVPAMHLNTYKTTYDWSGFKYHFILEGGNAERCAKPTINLKDGEITFDCETPDASFVSSYETLNTSTTDGNKMTLPNRFRITVFAQKYGLLDSPAATAEVEMTLGASGDVNGDGKVDVADHVKLSDIIMNK